jgi:MscS family membrane protein
VVWVYAYTRPVDRLGIVRERALELWTIPGVRAGVIVVGAVIAAKLLEVVIRKTLVVLARRTETQLDDVVIGALRRPIFLTVVLIGLGWAAHELALSAGQRSAIDSVLETFVLLAWASAAYKIGSAVLATFSRRSSASSIVQPTTLPVFELLLKGVVVGGALYFMFLAWRVDLTAWLASAGIIGIAIGFAAKDTLANLFSGIFIIVDAPYKVGDFIVLEGDLRGQVTKIGARSTRVLTMDDVEITVPNSTIGSSKIINETGGRSIRSRIKIGVDVAYGSDIDRVREILLHCAAGVRHVATEPAPDVWFTAFGSSGLSFQLLVWLETPGERGRVIDTLNSAVYKAFAAAGIEIPYTKADLYIKEFPEARPTTHRS